MKSLKIVTTVFLRASIEAFPQLFKDICDAIISHAAIFANIPYTEPQLTAFWQAMTDKTTDAREGSKASRDARDLQRTICNNVLLALSGAVLARAMQASTSQEAENIVNLSQFTLAKTSPEPAPPITQVEGVKGTWTGTYGQAIVEWDRADSGVVAYNVYTCLSQPQNPENWQFAGTTTRKKHVINGLPNLSQVYVQVVAIKDGAPSSPSEPVMVGVNAI